MARKSARASLRQEVADVFRRAILDAAEQVFGACGFADAKMTDIAQRAGLAAGTLYKHFSSKEEIFRALLEQCADEFVGTLDAELTSTPADLREQLLRLVRAVLGYVEHRSAVFGLFLELGATEWNIRRVGGADAERRYQSYLARFERVLDDGVREGVIRSDLSADELALLLTGSLNGFIHGWLMRGQKTALVDRAPQLIDVFLHGVETKS